MELIARREFRQVVAFTGAGIVGGPLAEAVGRLRQVPLDGGFVRSARALGISLGD